MKTSKLILFIPVASFLIACNEGTDSMQGSDSTYASPTTFDTTQGNNNETATVSTGAVSKDATTFLYEAALSGNMQVTLANVAIQRATSEQVQNLAKTIADQHTELNNKLKDISTSKNLQYPIGVTPDLQTEMDNITNNSGGDFDKAYLQWVIKEHQKDIEKFQQASTNLNDEQLKQFASIAIPIMQQHHDAAVAIKF